MIILFILGIILTIIGGFSYIFGTNLKIDLLGYVFIFAFPTGIYLFASTFYPVVLV